MVPKVTLFLSIFELLFDEGEKADSNAQCPHGRRQLTRVNLGNVLDEEL
jgi:hypothetical protein